MWWYGDNNRSKEATPAQIGAIWRVRATVGKLQAEFRRGPLRIRDRRLAKGEGKAFLVKITARSEFQKAYGNLGSGASESAGGDGQPPTENPQGEVTESKYASRRSTRVLPTLFIGSSAEGLKYRACP